MQVVTNLLANAIQHGEQDQPVRVAIDGTGADYVRIEVSNGGASRNRISARSSMPFRRGGRTPADSRGLGLGLYIVKEIAEAHAGTVAVVSPMDGKTTIFTVVLPRVHSVANPSPVGRAAASTPEIALMRDLESQH